METLKFIIDIIVTSIKGLLATNAGRRVVFENTKKTLQANLAEEKNPNTFFGKIKKVIGGLIDFISSPTFGRIIAVLSACNIALTGGFMWPVAAGIIATAVVAACIGIGIQAVRLRNFQKSQLEVAILEELSNELLKGKCILEEILELQEFKHLKAKDSIDVKRRKFSFLRSAGKQIGNSLCENAASTALSILTGNWIMVGINGATTIFAHGNNIKMRATQDMEYLKQQDTSKAIKATLGIDIPTKDVAKLLDLYQGVTGNEFPHKVPTFGSALWEYTINNGFSSKKSLLQYATPHNSYKIKPVKDTETVKQPWQQQKTVNPLQQCANVNAIQTATDTRAIKHISKHDTVKKILATGPLGHYDNRDRIRSNSI